MDRIKAHIVIVLVSLLAVPCFGQFKLSEAELQAKLKKIPQEYAYVHTSNSLYLAGEYMHFSLYCFNADTKKLTELSKVAYIELIHENGDRVFKHKLRIEKGVGSGDFFIPTTAPSGAYKLLGYTNWMQNGSIESLYTADITIINPYRSNSNVTQEINPSDSLSSNTNRPQQVLSKNPIKRAIQLPINKLLFDKRDLVSIDLSSMSKELLDGYYSLSVRKQNTLSAPILPTIDRYMDRLSFRPNNFSISNTNQAPRIPELRGELFLGKIAAKNSKKRVDHLHVSISIPGDQPYFSIVKSDKNGFFYFSIDRYYSGDQIIFDLIDSDQSDYTIELIDRTYTALRDLKFHKIKLDTTAKQYLLDRSVANQIENAYFKFKPDSTIVQEPSRFFDKYQGKIYELDEYTRFKTIRETIFEYVKDVVIRRVNSNKSVVRIKGYNFGTNSLALPLVLLDGVVIQDHNSLLDYESATISSITVYRDQFIIGPHIYQGALVVQSKAGQAPRNFERFGLPSAIQLFRSQDVKRYFKQNYQSNQDRKRLPDYRYQLLWQPVKKFTEKDASIEFYTSDVSGNFEVLLQGVSKEGKPISAIQVFSVQ